MAQKRAHPLYHSWAWMKRMSAKFEMDPEWKSDFNIFYTFNWVGDIYHLPFILYTALLCQI